MLRNVRHLRGYAILATDGVIGEVEDLYFDDDRWAIRYLVVDTGTWLPGRKVLISPHAIGRPDWAVQQLPVSLTRAQVADSPEWNTKMPVSRQYETEYLRYFGYPHYWGGAGLWGMGAYPGSLTTEDRFEEAMHATRLSAMHTPGDSHLRSCWVLTGYHIHATDGDIGYVKDVLVEDRTWAIRYLIVDTSNWWQGHDVLIAPQWIESVSWPDEKISVDLTRQAVRDAPPYDAAAQLDREQEQALHEHYGRTGYWSIDTDTSARRG